MLLNPNCSTIVCALPTYNNIKTAEEILADIYKSDMSDKTKAMLKNVLYEWSFDERQEVCTESYPDGTLGSFVRHAGELKGHIPNIKDLPEPRYVDNIGGGGHWEVVELAWMIAKLQVFGKITAEEAYELDESIGNTPLLLDECDRCLNKKPDITCEEYVKRVVGECLGRFEQTLKEKLEKMIDEVEQECCKPIVAK